MFDVWPGGVDWKRLGPIAMNWLHSAAAPSVLAVQSRQFAPHQLRRQHHSGLREKVAYRGHSNYFQWQWLLHLRRRRIRWLRFRLLWS